MAERAVCRVRRMSRRLRKQHQRRRQGAAPRTYLQLQGTAVLRHESCGHICAQYEQSQHHLGQHHPTTGTHSLAHGTAKMPEFDPHCHPGTVGGTLRCRGRGLREPPADFQSCRRVRNALLSNLRSRKRAIALANCARNHRTIVAAQPVRFVPAGYVARPASPD
jgi:hypothetical protein